MNENYSVAMPFIDESKSFVNGFECGQIWTKLQDGGSFVSYLVHTENSAQIQMICDYFKTEICRIDVLGSDPTWSLLFTTSTIQ